MSRRSEELKSLVGDLLERHRVWQADDSNMDPPDESYFDAVEAVVEAFEKGEIPADCRALADAAKELSIALDNYDNREDVAERMPEDEFWHAIGLLTKAVKTSVESQRNRRPLESIAELKLLPHMTDSQIAKMYGFVDRYGNLMIHLVQQELEKPGSVTKTPGAVDGRDWCDPRDLKERKREAAEESVAPVRKARKASPETPRELWQQGVTAQQAAKMLQRPLADVEKLFAELQAEHDKSLEAGEIESPKKQVIKSKKKQGKGASAIAKEMDIPEREVAEALSE